MDSLKPLDCRSCILPAVVPLPVSNIWWFRGKPLSLHLVTKNQLHLKRIKNIVVAQCKALYHNDDPPLKPK